jgi:hypothetical protein
MKRAEKELLRHQARDICPNQLFPPSPDEQYRIVGEMLDVMRKTVRHQYEDPDQLPLPF